MVHDSEENRTKCICLKCPSYPHGCNGERLYCAGGKSVCDIEARGCICTICPVYHAYKLGGIYYCDKDEVGESRIVMRKKRSEEEASFYQTLVDIKDMAATGNHVLRSMGAVKKLPFSLDDLHFVPAQVHRIPLNRRLHKWAPLAGFQVAVCVEGKVGCNTFISNALQIRDDILTALVDG